VRRFRYPHHSQSSTRSSNGFLTNPSTLLWLTKLLLSLAFGPGPSLRSLGGCSPWFEVGVVTQNSELPLIVKVTRMGEQLGNPCLMSCLHFGLSVLEPHPIAPPVHMTTLPTVPSFLTEASSDRGPFGTVRTALEIAPSLYHRSFSDSAGFPFV
jgi:hypothetical protein